jgi:hypothetical protein
VHTGLLFTPLHFIAHSSATLDLLSLLFDGAALTAFPFFEEPPTVFDGAAASFETTFLLLPDLAPFDPAAGEASAPLEATIGWTLRNAPAALLPPFD